MFLTFYIKQLKFDFEKHFIHLYILNLIHNLILIKSLFNFDINIKVFINHFYARIKNIFLIIFETF